MNRSSSELNSTLQENNLFFKVLLAREVANQLLI